MDIEFAPSAGKHEISEDRIRYVVRHCPAPLYPPEGDRDDSDLVIYLGPDENGVPLEIVAIEVAGRTLLVIHAMRLRRTYADEYARVNG